MRALILDDGLSRQSVAAARGLHSAGWSVGVASPIRGISAVSTSVQRWHRIPSAAPGSDGFVRGINGAIGEGRYEVVFGVRDVEVLALSAERERIHALVPYPIHERVLSAFDKSSLYEAAAAVGIAVPRVIDEDQAGAEGAGAMIVKARLNDPNALRLECDAIAAQLATGADEVRTATAAVRAAGAVPIVQEHLEGQLMAIEMVVDEHGGVIAEAQQVAERIYPPRTGISSRARTVPVNPELQAKVCALLARTGWFGLAELQFIRPADREPRLIDFNGRIYGSLALAIAAGANMPAAWAGMATGNPPNPRMTATADVRYQWLWGDLRRALAERRGGLAPDVLDTLRFARGATHSVWRRDDPRPAIRYVRLMLARAARKRLRR